MQSNLCSIDSIRNRERTAVSEAQKAYLRLDAKAHMIDKPECDLRFFGWRMMVPIHVIADEVAHCRADKGVGNADVLVVEPLGSETLIHLNAGGQPLVARVPGFADVRVGARVGIKLDRRRLYLFDSSGAPLA